MKAIILDQQQVQERKSEIVSAIREGKIFIYPTDTIYGLGCNALLEESVDKIRLLKMRDSKPLSVIAPSKDWILEHCVAGADDLDQYLPGPYTLFLRAKSGAVCAGVNPNDDTLGVRIPDHWFVDLVREAGVPFITTSVNVSGDKHMEKLEDVSQTILDKVDYVIYEGEKSGAPSQKIDKVHR